MNKKDVKENTKIYPTIDSMRGFIKDFGIRRNIHRKYEFYFPSGKFEEIHRDNFKYENYEYDNIMISNGGKANVIGFASGLEISVRPRTETIVILLEDTETFERYWFHWSIYTIESVFLENITEEEYENIRNAYIRSLPEAERSSYSL